MGTVSPLEDSLWRAFNRLLPEPPAAEPATDDELPVPFGWEQRAKSVYPMPGGYDAYLDSLSRLCDLIEEERPNATKLSDWTQQAFPVSPHQPTQLPPFLRKHRLLPEPPLT